MSKKNRSIDQLQNSIHEEASWRKKELSVFKSQLLSSSGSVQKVLLRSGIPLLYSHWEGYIKSVSFEYINFISLRKLSNNELNYNFLLLSIESKLNDFSQKKYSSRILALKDIVENLTSRSSIPTSYKVFTKANLNFERFKEILFLLDIDESEFELSEHLIDELLLKQRNHIAHGEYLAIDVKDFKLMYDKILFMIDLLSNPSSSFF